jgi:hypothetical protein
MAFHHWRLVAGARLLGMSVHVLHIQNRSQDHDLSLFMEPGVLLTEEGREQGVEAKPGSGSP